MTTLSDEVDFGFDDLPDYHDRIAQLRRQYGDRAPVKVHGRDTVMLLSEDLVLAAFGDEEQLPAMLDYAPKTQAALGTTIMHMTGLEHRQNRAQVSPAFRRQLMGDYIDDLLRPVAADLVRSFAGDGRAELVTQFTKPLPEHITEALLGLPAEYRDQCSRWAYELFLYRQQPEVALAAARSFTEMLEPLVRERRTNPGGDMISKLATAEVDGERLTDEEIFSFIRLLFPAGVDTTYLNLGNTLRALLTHPEQLAAVQADPDLIPWAIEEGMRWDPGVVGLQRIAPVAMTWHGIELAEGDILTMSMAAAGRDPEIYPNPDDFDVTRRVRARSAFGNGPHVCLGMWLARAEMEIGLRTLLETLPDLRLVDPDAAAVGNRLGGLLRGPARLDVEFTAVTP